jgi:SH3-like domain-containing protein
MRRCVRRAQECRRLRAAGALWTGLLLAATQSAPAASRIVGIEVQAGAKGLAIALVADQPIAAAGIDVKCKPVSSATSLVGVHIPQATYGLGVYRFTNLPPESPVTEVAAQQRDGADAVDLMFEVHVGPGAEVSHRVKGSRLLIHIGGEELPAFTWVAPTNADTDSAQEAAAQPAPIAEPQPVAASEGAAAGTAQSAPARAAQPLVCLRDVTWLQRGDVAQLQFAFSGPVSAKVRREGARAILLFSGVANSLSEQRLEPPGEQVFRSVELRQRAYDGAEWLGAIVTLSDTAAERFLVRQSGERVDMMIVGLAPSRYALWSAREGSYASADLTPPREQPPSEPPPAAVAPAPASAPPTVVAAPPSPVPAAEPPRVNGYLVTVGNNVNVRSAPTTDSTGNIVARLPRGATVGLLQELGEWRRILTADSLQGWVYGALLGTKSEAPEAMAAAVAAPRASAASMLPVDAVVSMAASASQTSPARTTPAAPPVAAPPVAAPPVAAPPSRDTSARARAEAEDRPLSELVRYTSYGRDPFLPLERNAGDAYANIENLELVGVLYDRADRIVLLQDEMFREKSYALREREPVSHGTVWRINPTSVIFLITEMGISRTYTLELKEPSPTTVQPRRGRS